MKQKKTNLIGLISMMLLFIVILTPNINAECTTADSNTQLNFSSINQSSYNEITFDTDEKWSDFVSFKPKANFNHIVYESIVGQLISTNYTIQWIMVGDNYSNINSTFVLKNGTTTINRSNYTISSANNRTFVLSFLDSRYNGSVLTASFNRTFVATVDDIFTNATGMTGLATFSTFIQSNTPSDYGDSKLFRPNPSTLYGDSINLTDWTVTYEKTTVTCGAECDRPVNLTLLNFIITLFLIGILVFLGYSLYNGSGVKEIITIVVVGIVMLITLVIIKNVISGVCLL